jgi:hypothetical protein
MQHFFLSLLNCCFRSHVHALLSAFFGINNAEQPVVFTKACKTTSSIKKKHETIKATTLSAPASRQNHMLSFARLENHGNSCD